MTPSDLEEIAAAYVDDELRSADDDFVESLLRQQQVEDITDLDPEAFSPKQRLWMEDILERVRDLSD